MEDFQNVILLWYKENGRAFPWRKKGLTNYQYIIAETLLQRTKAETVSNFFNEFLNVNSCHVDPPFLHVDPPYIFVAGFRS